MYQGTKYTLETPLVQGASGHNEPRVTIDTDRKDYIMTQKKCTILFFELCITKEIFSFKLYTHAPVQYRFFFTALACWGTLCWWNFVGC